MFLAQTVPMVSRPQSWLFQLKEQVRLRFHLSRTELALRLADTSHLSETQRTARARQLDALHDYWIAGLFPRNITDDLTRPAIKDDRGVLCAMAYLIATSGYPDFVDELARTNNHVYINDIHAGPLFDWLNQHGLTQIEAARIQPGYLPELTPQGVMAALGIGVATFGVVFTIIELWLLRALKRAKIWLPLIGFGLFEFLSAGMISVLVTGYIVDKWNLDVDGPILGVAVGSLGLAIWIFSCFGLYLLFSRRLQHTAGVVMIIIHSVMLALPVALLAVLVGVYSVDVLSPDVW